MKARPLAIELAEITTSTSSTATEKKRTFTSISCVAMQIGPGCNKGALGRGRYNPRAMCLEHLKIGELVAKRKNCAKKAVPSTRACAESAEDNNNEELGCRFIGSLIPKDEARQKWHKWHLGLGKKKKLANVNGNKENNPSLVPLHEGIVDGVFYDIGDDAYVKAGEKGRDNHIFEIVEMFKVIKQLSYLNDEKQTCLGSGEGHGFGEGQQALVEVPATQQAIADTPPAMGCQPQVRGLACEAWWKKESRSLNGWALKKMGIHISVCPSHATSSLELSEYGIVGGGEVSVATEVP
ncbi:hypothetical protein NL676_023564 [Syzygium grande]|nr:hypothetical protein NL676_023564 [Syzygium grande]